MASGGKRERAARKFGLVKIERYREGKQVAGEISGLNAGSGASGLTKER